MQGSVRRADIFCGTHVQHAGAWGEPVPKTEQDFKAVAIVRHTRDVPLRFEFLGMTSEERAQIAAIISRKPKACSAR